MLSRPAPRPNLPPRRAQAPPASRYVPPELWDDNTTAAELKWERRVQFDAQRGGNGVRQNEILQKAIGLE